MPKPPENPSRRRRLLIRSAVVALVLLACLWAVWSQRQPVADFPIALPDEAVLLPVARNGKWGAIDADGTLVIPTVHHTLALRGPLRNRPVSEAPHDMLWSSYCQFGADGQLVIEERSMENRYKRRFEAAQPEPDLDPMAVHLVTGLAEDRRWTTQRGFPFLVRREGETVIHAYDSQGRRLVKALPGAEMQTLIHQPAQLEKIAVEDIPVPPPSPVWPRNILSDRFSMNAVAWNRQFYDRDGEIGAIISPIYLYPNLDENAWQRPELLAGVERDDSTKIVIDLRTDTVRHWPIGPGDSVTGVMRGRDGIVVTFEDRFELLDADLKTRWAIPLPDGFRQLTRDADGVVSILSISNDQEVAVFQTDGERAFVGISDRAYPQYGLLRIALDDGWGLYHPTQGWLAEPRYDSVDPMAADSRGEHAWIVRDGTRSGVVTPAGWRVPLAERTISQVIPPSQSGRHDFLLLVESGDGMTSLVTEAGETLLAELDCDSVELVPGSPILFWDRAAGAHRLADYDRGRVSPDTYHQVDLLNPQISRIWTEDGRLGYLRSDFTWLWEPRK